MNSDSGSTLFAGSSPNFSHFVKLCEEIRITKKDFLPFWGLRLLLSRLHTGLSSPAKSHIDIQE
jgi:hypothetical protein